jgi:YhcH/YjgK/YiaL family protein
MIYGHINAAETWQFLGPAWKTAFKWLKTVTPATASGIVRIEGDLIYANIHGYPTLPFDQCRFESHRRYADLQYCISGGEIIDWQLTSALKPDGPFNDEKDLQFHLPAPSQCSMRMTPGAFAIFFPSDAHAPKHADGIHPDIFKLVIKVSSELW